jgi:hypothetical protein
LDLAGDCWLCMQIYEVLCCVLVGSCLKTNKSERSWGIFSYERMLLIRKDEEVYNPTEISEQILKNFVWISMDPLKCLCRTFCRTQHVTRRVEDLLIKIRKLPGIFCKMVSPILMHLTVFDG